MAMKTNTQRANWATALPQFVKGGLANYQTALLDFRNFCMMNGLGTVEMSLRNHLRLHDSIVAIAGSTDKQVASLKTQDDLRDLCRDFHKRQKVEIAAAAAKREAKLDRLRADTKTEYLLHAGDDFNLVARGTFAECEERLPGLAAQETNLFFYDDDDCARWMIAGPAGVVDSGLFAKNGRWWRDPLPLRHSES